MALASHALDFDDINKRMRGHPSVAILPALLAAGPARSGTELIDALIVGTEVACIVGEMMGETHYLRGFHTTATVGTVAAAAAVARLLRCDADQTASALSIAATRAAGCQGDVRHPGQATACGAGRAKRAWRRCAGRGPV